MGSCFPFVPPHGGDFDHGKVMRPVAGAGWVGGWVPDQAHQLRRQRREEQHGAGPGHRRGSQGFQSVFDRCSFLLLGGGGGAGGAAQKECIWVSYFVRSTSLCFVFLGFLL